MRARDSSSPTYVFDVTFQPILTVQQVLLYNFFEDSSASAADWRVILNALDQPPPGVPLFDWLRHASICSELKSLYVGVTRARNNCWIWDVSNKGDSMKVVSPHVSRRYD